MYTVFYVPTGSFRTAPDLNKTRKEGYKFDYVLASCMNWRQQKDQPVWEKGIIDTAFKGKYPDLAILAGDTIYLHHDSDIDNEKGVKYDRVWYRHYQQRQEQHFAKFIANVPTYSTWNDHDYGENNTDRNQKGKGVSLKAWKSLWANPGYASNNPDDGVYYSLYWGPDVQFIVTDDHWDKNNQKKNRLGGKQTQWIENELIKSTAIFKIIVIGSDIMDNAYDDDLKNIGKIITKYKISGVLFNAGDIHRNEFKQKSNNSIMPYPITQITSSGIAKSWRLSFVHIAVDTTKSDPQLTAYFYQISDKSPKDKDKNPFKHKWINDRKLKCSDLFLSVGYKDKENIQRHKENTCTETIKLSQLTPI